MPTAVVVPTVTKLAVAEKHMRTKLSFEKRLAIEPGQLCVGGIRAAGLGYAFSGRFTLCRSASAVKA